MSISLKNHEDRISALENKINNQQSGGKLTCEKLHGYMWMEDSQSYKLFSYEQAVRFDFLAIGNMGNTNNQNRASRHNDMSLVPVALLTRINDDSEKFWTIGLNDSDKLYMWLDASGFYVMNSNSVTNDNGITWVYGVKFK